VEAAAAARRGSNSWSKIRALNNREGLWQFGDEDVAGDTDGCLRATPNAGSPVQAADTPFACMHAANQRYLLIKLCRLSGGEPHCSSLTPGSGL
jgi:hypothetical protein